MSDNGTFRVGAALSADVATVRRALMHGRGVDGEWLSSRELAALEAFARIEAALGTAPAITPKGPV